jgi:hypothetical protein
MAVLGGEGDPGALYRGTDLQQLEPSSLLRRKGAHSRAEYLGADTALVADVVQCAEEPGEVDGPLTEWEALHIFDQGSGKVGRVRDLDTEDGVGR